MEYIDSSVFIGAFLPSDPNHKICRKVVDAIIRDRLLAAISVFGLAEIGGFFYQEYQFKNVKEMMGVTILRAGGLE